MKNPFQESANTSSGPTLQAKLLFSACEWCKVLARELLCGLCRTSSAWRRTANALQAFRRNVVISLSLSFSLSLSLCWAGATSSVPRISMFLSSLPLQDVMNNQQDQTLQTAFASMLRCQRTGDGPEPGEHEGRAGEACNPGLRVSVQGRDQGRQAGYAYLGISRSDWCTRLCHKECFYPCGLPSRGPRPKTSTLEKIRSRDAGSRTNLIRSLRWPNISRFLSCPFRDCIILKSHIVE